MGTTPPPISFNTYSAAGSALPMFIPNADVLINQFGFTKAELNTKAGKAFVNSQIVTGAKGGSPDSSTWKTAMDYMSTKYPGLWSKLTSWANVPSAVGAPHYTTASMDLYTALQSQGGDFSGLTKDIVYGGKSSSSAVVVAGPNGLATSNASAGSQASAYGTMLNYLDSWGMGNLMPTIQKMITAQGDNLTNTQELLNYVRNTAEYKQNFPGLTERNASLGPGAEHMTEAQYQQYVTTVQGLTGLYGLPEGTITKAAIGDLIKNNVSTTELESRINKGYVAYNNADQNVKNLLAQEYGLTPGQGVAYFLNPTAAQATIEKNIAAATIQGYAQGIGLKGMSQAGAEQLAGMVKMAGTAASTGGAADPYAAYSMSQLRSDLATAAKDAQLTVAAPGSARPTVSTEQLIGSQVAGYAGTNQAAEQVQVARAEQAAAAPFEKGGGYVENAKGVVGLGSART